MNTNDFKDFCAKAKKIIKGNMTVTACEYVKISGNMITVTDLDSYIQMKVDEEFDNDIYINFTEFDKVISKCKNSPLEIIKGEGYKVIIKTNKGNFTFDNSLVFHSDGSSMFPEIDFKVTDTNNILTKKDIELVKKASVYAANDDLRPALACVYIDKEHIVATDAHTLGKYKREKNQDFTYLIPKKTVPLLDDNSYKVFSGEKYILLQDDKYSYHYRKEESNYPNYNNVIPKVESTKTFFEIKSADLLSICDSALIVLGKNGGSLITFDIDVEKNIVKFQSEDEHKGSSFEKEITCDVEGDNLKIGFDVNLVVKVLKNEKLDKCLFMLTDSNRAALINEEALIMPIIITN